MGLSAGLTTAVTVFFWIVMAASAFACYASIDEIGKFNEAFDFPSSRTLNGLLDAEDLTQAATGVVYLVGFILGILLMVWGNQAYRATSHLQAPGRSWSSGWAVGGWFIPFANAVIPKLVFNEVDRLSVASGENAPREDWKRQPTTPSGNWWWFLFIGGIAAVAIGNAIAGSEVDSRSFDEDTYRLGLMVAAAGLAALSGAHAAGAIFVKTLGGRLTH